MGRHRLHIRWSVRHRPHYYSIRSSRSAIFFWGGGYVGSCVFFVFRLFAARQLLAFHLPRKAQVADRCVQTGKKESKHEIDFLFFDARREKARNYLKPRFGGCENTYAIVQGYVLVRFHSSVFSWLINSSPSSSATVHVLQQNEGGWSKKNKIGDKRGRAIWRKKIKSKIKQEVTTLCVSILSA